MIERLEEIDRSLFLFLNGLHSDWMDPIMYLISHKLFWVPVYLLIFFMIQRRFGWKGLGFFVLGLSFVILLCDQISSTVLKQLFARYRPCNNLDIMDIVHKVNDRCGRGFSFVSGHATNYFGVSVFAARLIDRRAFTIPIILWAALIAYSRVYLGVHYPADILAGSVLGVILGTFVFRLYSHLVPEEYRS